MIISATDTINTSSYSGTERFTSSTSSAVVGLVICVSCVSIIPSYGSMKLNSFMENKTMSKLNQSIDSPRIVFSNSATNELIYKSLKNYDPIHEVNHQKSKHADWFLEYTEKLTELSHLPIDWDSYGAEPPNNLALDWASQILEILSEIGFSPARITPSVENGVGISFISDNKYADIECFNEGDILAVTSDGQGNPEVWEVEATTLGIKFAIEKIRVFLQR